MSNNTDNFCTHPKLRGVPCISSQVAELTALAVAVRSAKLHRLMKSERTAHAYWARLVSAVAAVKKGNTHAVFVASELLAPMGITDKAAVVHLRACLSNAIRGKTKLVEIVGETQNATGKVVNKYKLTAEGILQANRWIAYVGGEAVPD